MTKAPPNPPELNFDTTFNLPARLKIAIADCITIYSRIESCIIETLWILEDADLQRKKQIAKEWGDKNLTNIKKVVNSIPDAQTNAIWPAMRELRNERNLIGHGVWLFTTDNRPLVVWHSKFLESDEWVGAEYFDWERFEYFLKRAEVLLDTFTKFKELLELDLPTSK